MAGNGNSQSSPSFLWQQARQCGWPQSLLLSLVTALLAALVVFDLYLLGQLLTTRGEVVLRCDQLGAYMEWTGSRRVIGDVAAGRGEMSYVRLADQGLCAAAWQTRHRWWGGLLSGLVNDFPWMRHNLPALACVLAGIAVLSFLYWLASVVQSDRCSRTAIEVALRLRERLHWQALRVASGVADEKTLQGVLDLFLTETERLRERLEQVLRTASRQPLILAFCVVAALSVHWLLALQCLVPLAACWYLVEREKARFEHARRLSEDRARVDVRLLSEGIRRPRLVCGYGMQEYESRRFELFLQRMREQFSMARLGQVWLSWMVWLVAVGTVAMVGFLVGIKVLLPEENPRRLDTMSAVLLLFLFGQMYRSTAALVRLKDLYRGILGSWEKVERFLAQTPTVTHAVGGKVLRPPSKSIEFEGVSCSLPGKGRVLDGVELRLPVGDATALVSLNRLEPLAMAFLLPRFVDPDSGRVLFDGQDIAWATVDSVRSCVLLVEGKDAVFTGTVLENLTCGSEAFSREEVIEAAQATLAHEVISQLPQGYDTQLGEHGEWLHPGDEFLLALTRALLRDPPVLIVQEPEQPLDEASKQRIDAAYDRLLKNRTVLFLPSRLSTVRRASRVVLLHQGRVVDVQPYSLLIKSSALFRHWEYVCFNEFRQVEAR